MPLEATVQAFQLIKNSLASLPRKLGGVVMGAKNLFLKGLILAQNERWRRGLGMQVERRRGSNIPD